MLNNFGFGRYWLQSGMDVREKLPKLLNVLKLTEEWIRAPWREKKEECFSSSFKFENKVNVKNPSSLLANLHFICVNFIHEISAFVAKFHFFCWFFMSCGVNPLVKNRREPQMIMRLLLLQVNHCSKFCPGLYQCHTHGRDSTVKDSGLIRKKAELQYEDAATERRKIKYTRCQKK